MGAQAKHLEHNHQHTFAYGKQATLANIAIGKVQPRDEHRAPIQQSRRGRTSTPRQTSQPLQEECRSSVLMCTIPFLSWAIHLFDIHEHDKQSVEHRRKE